VAHTSSPSFLILGSLFNSIKEDRCKYPDISHDPPLPDWITIENLQRGCLKEEMPRIQLKIRIFLIKIHNLPHCILYPFCIAIEAGGKMFILFPVPGLIPIPVVLGDAFKTIVYPWLRRTTEPGGLKKNIFLAEEGAYDFT
jgi:hypothetical protein